jgi:hypothetical protein
MLKYQRRIPAPEQAHGSVRSSVHKRNLHGLIAHWDRYEGGSTSFTRCRRQPRPEMMVEAKSLFLPENAYKSDDDVKLHVSRYRI